MKGGILSLLCGDEEGDGHLQDDRHLLFHHRLSLTSPHVQLPSR